jgi:hypothetical protein
MGFTHRLLLLLSVWLMLGPALQAQDFRPPLNIPLRLTGNFGELRNNHFHGGLDIATDQATGLSVYACADGYVSRVVVGPYGYGKALYLAHPNGLTTVYGHLEGFGEGIAEWVRNRQYALESFELDEYLKPGQLPVVRGQVVARSGNTGASGGPHLHFEVRRGDTPLNPLQYGFTVADSRPPESSHLFVYPHWEGQPSGVPREVALVRSGNRWQPPGGVLRVPGQSAGLGVYAWDRQDGRENRNGVYRVELLLNGKPHFQFRLDSLSYAQRRYLNAHLDYRINLESQRKVHRLFRLPGNGLGIYQYLDGRGLIPLQAGRREQVEINLYDYAGNRTTIAFALEADTTQAAPTPPRAPWFFWNQPGQIQTPGMALELPQGSLYEDQPLEHGREQGGSGSDTHWVADAFTPLHREATLRLAAGQVPERLRDRALIVHLDHAGRRKALGGQWENGYLVTRTDRLGKFYVAIDSVPPSLQSVNVQAGMSVGKGSVLRFRISDNLSGIQSYRGEIDGQWVLFEYEPKSSLLFHTLEGRLEPGRRELVLRVHDERGNSTEKRIPLVIR